MKTFIGNPYNEEYENDSDELGDLSRDTFMDNIIEDEWPITDGWFGNVAVTANMTQDVNDEGWNSDAPSNAFILEPGVENDLYGELSDIEDDSETEDYIFDPSTLYSFNYINVLMDDESEDSDNPEESENN